MTADALRAALQAAAGPDAAQALAIYTRSLRASDLLTQGAGLQWRQMPLSAAAAAQQLFAVLRELDSTGVNTIWVETPPNTSDWAGVRDRLERAAA